MHHWHDQTREIALMLTRWSSVTDSTGEGEFAAKLHDYLTTIPYFQKNPSHVQVIPTTNDDHERANVFALVRGSAPETIMLAGHFDTVSIQNYADLQEWACDPEQLLPRLCEKLQHSPNSHDQQALHDLNSGDFLPGRGLLDMKSGLAAGLAVLLHYVQQTERHVNLLFVATPDEENASHGMRSAMQTLPQLCQEWNINIVAAINLDAMSDQGDGEWGQAVFLGTVGKLLPTVLVIGQDTHAGYPFEGINATALAASIVQQIEWNPTLCDTAEGETSPVPVCLKLADLKDYYDVTTPAMAWCYFNLLIHGRSIDTVLHSMLDHVQLAMDDHVSLLIQRAKKSQVKIPTWQPKTYAFEQLIHLIAAQRQQTPEIVIAELLNRVSDPSLDSPTLTCRLMQMAWQWSGLQAPAAIVGFGSLHYPISFLRDQSPHHTRLHNIVQQQTQALSQELNTPITVRGFFAGISDMSFVGGAIDHADEAVLAQNTPLWTTRLAMDYAVIRNLNIPIVNIGPWGRDYHQRNERLYTPYAFNTLPELIWRIVKAIDDRR